MRVRVAGQPLDVLALLASRPGSTRHRGFEELKDRGSGQTRPSQYDLSTFRGELGDPKNSDALLDDSATELPAKLHSRSLPEARLPVCWSRLTGPPR